MAKLSFIGELNERQTEYANKIAEKAKEMGIPPDLAVSIAYHESRLNPDAKRGKDGEFGIMQVWPVTGNKMGFTNKDLADPEKNIEAGLKILKQNLEIFGGDRKMATVGYNKGPDHAFFYGGELPAVTKKYIKDMQGYGAYGEANQPVQKLTEQEQLTEPAEANGDMVSVPKPPEPPAPPDMSGADRAAKFLFGGAGAGVGTGVALAGVGLDAFEDRAVRMASKTEAAKLAEQRAAGVVPQQPTGVASQQPTGTTSGEKWAAKTGYGKGAGTVQDVSSAYQRAIGQGKLSGRMDKLWGPPLQGENPNLAQRLIDRAKPTPSPAPLPPPTPIPKPTYNLTSVIDDFKSMMRPVIKPIETASKYLAGPLGGLSAGLDVAEIAHEYDKPENQRDYTKMGLKAASGLGGALSMLPGAARFGIPLSLGATGIQYLRENPDFIKNNMQKISNIPVLNENPDFIKNKMQGISKIPLLDEMTGPLP